MKYFILLMALLFVAGCSSVVCNSPYIQVGADCCLDSDTNKICDKDEEIKQPSTVIITEKQEQPPKIVEKKVREYVCTDGSIVDNTKKCPVEIPEPKLQTLPTLVTNNEVGTVIEEVKLRPACSQGENAGEIFFKVGTVPSSVVVEVRESDGEYEEVHSRSGLYDGFMYFGICDDCYKGEFTLKKEMLYVLRLKFDQTNVYSRVEYSNEHLIDTRASSNYLTKVCSR